MAGGEFQHGLFGCFDNCGVCIISYFLPCYVHGRIAEKVGEDCLVCGLTQIIPIANWIFRTQIRGKVRRPETCKLGTHYPCSPAVLTAREHGCQKP